MIAGRSRNIEVLVGLFLLGSMGVLLAMVIFFAGKQQAFEERFDVQARFSRVAGLETGATVRLSGINVGKVASVEFDRSGLILVRMEILGKYQKWIRTDSKARITSAGLLGDKVMDISVGSVDAEVLEENAILPSEDPIDVGELIELARPAIADLEITISNLSLLTTGLADARDRFGNILENVSSITEKVDRSEGLLGKLITDREMAENFLVLVAKARGTAEHVEVAAGNLAVFSKDLPALSSKAQGLMADLKEASGKLGEMATKGSTTLENFRAGSVAFRAGLERLPGIVERVESSADNVDVTLGNFREGSQSFKEAMGKLPGIMDKGGSALEDVLFILRNVKEASEDLPGIASQGGKVIRSADELLKGLRRNRVIRGVLSLEEEGEMVEVQIEDQRDTTYPH